MKMRQWGFFHRWTAITLLGAAFGLGTNTGCTAKAPLRETNTPANEASASVDKSVNGGGESCSSDDECPSGQHCQHIKNGKYECLPTTVDDAARAAPADAARP